MSLLDSIMQQMGGETLTKLSSQIGADEATTQKAIGAALPTLLGAISRNAAKPDGAEALHKALEKDHDGGVLDNLGSLIGNPAGGSGSGILKHVLGGKRGGVESGLSAVTGLEPKSTSSLLETLAPMVMGQLGREQKKGGLDTSALVGLLGRERDAAERVAPKELGLIGKLLDADGDGDNDMADFVSKGAGVLGKMFGK